MRLAAVPLLLVMMVPWVMQAQTSVNAESALQRSIKYHDPSGRWSTFARTLVLREWRPNGEDRTVHVSIDKPNERFVHEREHEGMRVRGELDHEACSASLNGSPDISREDAERFGLTCALIKRRRNYYQYLYGLPMKLRDAGTILAPEATPTTFNGRDVLMLSVSYDQEVGSDVWRFYLDPGTFQLVGYRFYHDEAKNDGEYITLEGEHRLDDMRLPKTRKWYRNSDGEYIGMDTIQSHERVGYRW